ncbi:MAG TPA: acyl-CoA thioesterase domain-containing protein [Acidimicrobiales bacterium]|nr:acyl-CoA thioesterase domain-containing protein [Acidimicrobiales bacterium]
MTLSSILNLEDVGEDAWRGYTPPGSGRSDIFGGQVAGQALRAATLTVPPDRLPNSVHCYFLRRGQSALPLDIHVERLRSGRTYTARRVEVRQEAKTIFAMLASFHVEEPSPEYEHLMPPEIPDPDGLPAADDHFGWETTFEMRTVEVADPVVRWWGKVPSPFPDDPALHVCALVYASDMRAGGAAIAAMGYGTGWPPESPGGRPAGNFGSLDHAIWIHRVPAVDDWFFCEVRPLTARDSRGLVLGTMFDRRGRHLATFTQEMFLKVAGDPPPG